MLVCGDVPDIDYWLDTLERSERVLGDDHAITRRHRYNLADIMNGVEGDFEGALFHYRKLGSLTEQSPVLFDMGRRDEAIDLILEVVRKRRGGAVGRRFYPLTILVHQLCLVGRAAEAEPFAKEALEICDAEIHGAERRFMALGRWGLVLRETERLEEAETTFREAFELSPSADEDVGVGLDFAVCLLRLGKLDEAERRLLRAIPNLTLRRLELGCHAALGDVYLAQDRFQEAEHEAMQAYAGRHERYGPDNT